MSFLKFIALLSTLACLAGYAANPNDSIPFDTIQLDDGSLYIGQIQDSLFNGQGRCIYADGTIYEGTWKDGLWDGQGTVVYPDGDIYKGDFRNHLKAGNGTYYYGSGARYEGEWADDKFNGHGKLFFEDGGRYDGAWKDDMKHGYGRLVSYDGHATTGYFYYDEYLGMPLDTEIARDSTLTDELKSWGFTQEPPRGMSGLSLGVSYGTKSMATLTLWINQSDHFFYGASIGVNLDPPIRGKNVMGVGFKSFSNDIHLVGEYVASEYMVEAGFTFLKKFSMGGSIGVGNLTAYMNCKANGNPDLYKSYSLKYGDSYTRRGWEYLTTAYRAYMRYSFEKEKTKALLYLGYGNADGMFFGVSWDI